MTVLYLVITVIISWSVGWVQGTITEVQWWDEVANKLRRQLTHNSKANASKRRHLKRLQDKVSKQARFIKRPHGEGVVIQ